MIIKSVTFEGSAVGPKQYPKDNLPQIVFSGRSNVGKSSFINAMLNRKNIARVSQTPGKTRLVNFFLINEAFHFVDIPGYGYAKVNKQQIQDFQIIIEQYLLSQQVTLAVLLLDIRRTPNADDLLMYEYFKSLNVDILIVLTKADKLSNNQKFNQKKAIEKVIQPRPIDSFITFSAETMEHRDEIWEYIEEHLQKVTE
ncbi:MAG: YihA family ribosome biogenesis GTP-binding protein [Bacilli bacterium]|nr:YihA family ribosome biogenesis GTP-binding protein [Bacilli bacterium]